MHTHSEKNHHLIENCTKCMLTCKNCIRLVGDIHYFTEEFMYLVFTRMLEFLQATHVSVVVFV